MKKAMTSTPPAAAATGRSSDHARTCCIRLPSVSSVSSPVVPLASLADEATVRAARQPATRSSHAATLARMLLSQRAWIAPCWR